MFWGDAEGEGAIAIDVDVDAGVVELEVAIDVGQDRKAAELGFELVGEIRIVAQKLLGILASLAQPDIAVVEPCAALFNDIAV